MFFWIYPIYAIFITWFLSKLIYKDLSFTKDDVTDIPLKWKPFARYDRQKWRQWEIYLGALILLPIRIIIFLILFPSCCLSLVIAGYGIKPDQEWPQYRNVRFKNKIQLGVLLSLTQIYNKVVIYEFEGLYLPSFQSELTQQEKCKQYAESVREIMSKCLGVEKVESSDTDTWDYYYHLFPQVKPKKV